MSDIANTHVVLNAEGHQVSARLTRRAALKRGIFGALALYLGRVMSGLLIRLFRPRSLQKRKP